MRGILMRGGVAALLAAVVVVALQSGGEAALGQTGSQGLALAPDYTVQRVNNPDPSPRANMGWLGIANAGDLNGDNADDLLVPNYAGPGQIYLFSGADGQLLRTLTMPDADTSAERSAGNFVYPAKLPDVASCPGTGANNPCPAIGPGDGVPEIIIGGTGADIAGAAPDMGRAYVFDGATGALLKKVQMPADDLAFEAANFPEGKSFSFGRAVISPSSPFPANAPAAIKVGDMTGGGEADFMVGNPTFYETADSNPACDPGPCAGSGRAYFFRGEDITGSANEILDAPFRVVKNPAPKTGTDHQRFGHAFIAVGDVGRCNTSPGAGVLCPAGTTAPDGRPDIVVSAHRAEAGGVDKAGVVWLVDGATGAMLRRYDHPEPQEGALFGYTVGTMSTAVGDVDGSPLPDIYAPAVGQVVDEVGQGRGYVLNGDWAGSPTLLARVDDPTPNRAENFGAPASGIGDVTGDGRNEVFVGVAGPWVPGDNVSFTGHALVVEPATGEIMLQLDDPDRQAGSGFGQGAVHLGDVNGDGLMDFAVDAGRWTGEFERTGRLYIFRSEAPPPPPAPAPPPPVAPAVNPCGDPTAAGYLHPAKLRVSRARVLREDRRLDVLAPITSLAEGEVKVTYQGDNRTDTFNAAVTEANTELDRISILEPITRGQARLGTGIANLEYLGDDDTRPEFVRLRAASQRAELDVEEVSLIGDRLSAKGSLTDKAQGVIRLRYSYLDPDGTPNVHEARAETQDDGDWKLDDDVVPFQLAQCGGYLSIQFTGYFERRIRGEQVAYQLNAGQTRRP